LWQGTPVCAAARLGVLESLIKTAPIAVMKSLQGRDVAQALADFVAAPPIADAWRGQVAGAQSNREIAQAFARLFFGEANET
jgi:hypothetical protein